mgnify:FL=1
MGSSRKHAQLVFLNMENGIPIKIPFMKRKEKIKALSEKKLWERQESLGVPRERKTQKKKKNEF